MGSTKSDLIFDILKRFRTSENKPEAIQDDESVDIEANNDEEK